MHSAGPSAAGADTADLQRRPRPDAAAVPGVAREDSRADESTGAAAGAGAAILAANGRLDAHVRSHAVLALQRAAGNMAVQRMIQRATILDANGVGHEENDSALTTDAQGNTRDAARRIVTIGPDGVYRELPDQPPQGESSGGTATTAATTTAAPAELSDADATVPVTAPAAGTEEAAQPESSGGGSNTFLEGAAGLLYGTTQGLAPGGFLAPSPAPRSRAFEFFRGAGQVATGIAETVAGVAGEVGGGALDVTGVGALVGVPVNIASAGLIANGVVGAGAGFGTLAHAMSMGGENEGGGSGDSSAPGRSSEPATENIPREVYNSPKEAPTYPQNFRPAPSGTRAVRIDNRGLLAELRKIEPGDWRKMYKDGFDASGNRISVHYFRSPSGKAFNVKVVPGWSNL